MYTAHTSTLPFKDKRPRSLVPICVSILANTSYQFRSSWKPGPNHTPRMQTDLSLQRKGPGREMPPLQAPKHRPSLLSKLILAPATSSYLSTAFFTAFMSDRWDTSVYAETFALRRPEKGTQRRTGFAAPSLSLRSKGSKVRA